MVTPEVSVVGMHANSVRPMRNSRGEKGISSVRKPMNGVISKMATRPYDSEGNAVLRPPHPHVKPSSAPETQAIAGECYSVRVQ